MYTIKITTKKKEKLVEHAEKALKHLGKLMQCVEDLGDEDSEDYYNSKKGSYGNRYGNKMNEKEDWDDDEDDYPVHEKYRRSSRY